MQFRRCDDSLYNEDDDDQSRSECNMTTPLPNTFYSLTEQRFFKFACSVFPQFAASEQRNRKQSQIVSVGQHLWVEPQV